MKKLDKFKLATAVAAAFAVIHTSFDILSLVAPDTLKFIFNTWFHGFNLQILVVQDVYSWNLPKIVFGWVTSVTVAWIIGFLVGSFYNFFLGKD